MWLTSIEQFNFLWKFLRKTNSLEQKSIGYFSFSLRFELMIRIAFLCQLIFLLIHVSLCYEDFFCIYDTNDHRYSFMQMHIGVFADLGCRM